MVVGAMNHYWSMSKPVLVVMLTTIDCYSSPQ